MTDPRSRVTVLRRAEPERDATPPSVAFGELLRRLRLAAGMTQEELAERAAISARSISDFERGLTHRPQRETVRLLSDALALAEDDRTLFASVARGRPTALPQVMPRAQPRHNLPSPLTRLVGRESDLAGLCALLRQGDVRLVTVTGAGGIGKTRLALDAAAVVLDAFPDGVFFVPLAAVRDPGRVLAAIAQVLEIAVSGGQQVRESLVSHLGRKRILLVLDNFEQIAPAATAIAELLRSCGNVKALVTSRAHLNVHGEHEWMVRPLALPHANEPDDPETVRQSPAVALFLDRAMAGNAEFRLVPENAAAVAAICIRLDGIPLAIELAAARIKVLSPSALLARLTHRLPILTNGASDLPARHQTMRDTIAWSYDLLQPDEQRAFRRLSVFIGGWTLDAAEMAGFAADGAALEILSVLVGASLVNADVWNGTPRYTMLETIREYGEERLYESGESDEIRQRHAAYFRTLAQEMESHLTGQDQVQSLALLDVEHGNIGAALAWYRAAGDEEAGAHLAAAVWQYWYVRGYLSEGRAWLEEFLTHGPRERDGRRALLWAKALNGAGTLAQRQGDYTRAMALLEEALRLSRAQGDRAGIAFSFNAMGAVALEQSDYRRADEYFAASLALRRDIGERREIAASLSNLGRVARYRGEFARAADLYRESEAIRRAIEDTEGVAIALGNQGHMARDQGDRTRALPLLEESLALYRDLAGKRGIAIALTQLAMVACDDGVYPRARQLGLESLALRRDLEDKWGIGQTQMVLGDIAAATGDTARARDLYKESLAMHRAIGSTLGIVDSLERIAWLTGPFGEWDRATRLLASTTAHRARIGAPLLPVDRPKYNRAIVLAQAALGDDRFAAAWGAGTAMGLDRVCGDTSAETEIRRESRRTG